MMSTIMPNMVLSVCLYCLVANVGGNRRAATPKVTTWQSGQLHLLVCGDRVLIQDESEQKEATVKIIDRFRQILLLDLNGNQEEVHISKLCRIEGNQNS